MTVKKSFSDKFIRNLRGYLFVVENKGNVKLLGISCVHRESYEYVVKLLTDICDTTEQEYQQYLHNIEVDNSTYLDLCPPHKSICRDNIKCIPIMRDEYKKFTAYKEKNAEKDDFSFYFNLEWCEKNIATALNVNEMDMLFNQKKHFTNPKVFRNKKSFFNLNFCYLTSDNDESLWHQWLNMQLCCYFSMQSLFGYHDDIYKKTMIMTALLTVILFCIIAWKWFLFI